MDRTLSFAATPDQSGPERDGNEEVHRISTSSSFTGASPSDCLMLYPAVESSYSSAEMQSLYSIAPDNWVGVWNK